MVLAAGLMSVINNRIFTDLHDGEFNSLGSDFGVDGVFFGLNVSVTFLVFSVIG